MWRSAAPTVAEVGCAVAQFVEKPRVLDRDYCLVGESLNQLDLLLGEWTYGSPVQDEHANWNLITQERHA